MNHQNIIVRTKSDFVEPSVGTLMTHSKNGTVYTKGPQNLSSNSVAIDLLYKSNTFNS